MSSKRDVYYGNCLLGAVLLMIRHRTWKLSSTYLPTQSLPHFYVIDQSGTAWHFRRVDHVLPKRFSWLLFRGRYARMRLSTHGATEPDYRGT